MLLTIKSIIVQWYANHPAISTVIGTTLAITTGNDINIDMLTINMLPELIKAISFLISSIAALIGAYIQWKNYKSKKKK